MRIVAAVILVAFVLQCQVEAGNSAAASKMYLGASPHSLVNIGDNTFYFGPPGVTVSYENAMKICNDIGMSLVSFETEGKYLAVKLFMQDNGYSDSTWTSGRKFAENKWYWGGSGQIFSYTAWSANEPDDMSCYACASFTIFTDWYDSSCGGIAAYICE